MKSELNGDLTDYPPDQVFTSQQIEDILAPTVHRTLGEVDVNGVFEAFAGRRRVTGIAGDVIEQSVLGYRPNSRQGPDILVDGVPTELKVTGIYIDGEGDSAEYSAKEPMSITAVSIDRIVDEEFDLSNFRHKIDSMLVVFYWYKEGKGATLSDYADFPIEGYCFVRFDDSDMRALERDWTIVRDFLRDVNDRYEDRAEGYRLLSSALRDRLMLIDTAPKYPNPPRFRFKRAFVDTIVKRHFQGATTGTVVLDGVDSFAELDAECHRITETYRGMSVGELMGLFGIGRMGKSVVERLVIGMFGGEASRMNRIDVFVKAGVTVRSLVLSSKGGKTEDMKLMPINFGEFLDEDVEFEDSEVYNYFAERQFLFAVFREADGEGRFEDDVFVGFKRLTFPIGCITGESEVEGWRGSVRGMWEATRETVRSGELREYVCTHRDGTPIVNRNGTVRTGINFPKSRDFSAFIRGGGKDSSVKNECVAGIRMYRQFVWAHGGSVVKLLDGLDYLRRR